MASDRVLESTMLLIGSRPTLDRDRLDSSALPTAIFDGLLNAQHHIFAAGRIQALTNDRFSPIFGISRDPTHLIPMIFLDPQGSNDLPLFAQGHFAHVLSAPRFGNQLNSKNDGNKNNWFHKPLFRLNEENTIVHHPQDLKKLDKGWGLGVAMGDSKTTEVHLSSNDYQIREVKTSSDLKKFLSLPLKIYPRESRFVMPLNLHMKMMMGKLGTPEKHFFLAYHRDQVVARIGCKTHKHGAKTTLHFGFFECVEGHSEAVRLLLENVRRLFPDLKLMGPFHFRLEDPYVGVLVDGFNFDPCFLMPFNPPYYDEYLKAAGLGTAMDLYTYHAEAANGLPKSLLDNAADAKSRGFKMRPMDPKAIRKEATTIQGIFNDALSKNWGYEEFLDEQVNEMVMLLRTFIDPRVVFFVGQGDRDVGCLIMIPDYNPLIKSGRGRLSPKVIWDFLTKKKTIHHLRGYALGVLREFHGQKIASLVVDYAWTECVKAGYNTGEISWILASNGPMNELSKHLGGQQSKTYRIYEAPEFSPNRVQG